MTINYDETTKFDFKIAEECFPVFDNPSVRLCTYLNLLCNFGPGVMTERWGIKDHRRRDEGKDF